jgi:hypothetical protein
MVKYFLKWRIPILGLYEEALILLDPLVKTEQFGQVKY